MHLIGRGTRFTVSLIPLLAIPCRGNTGVRLAKSSRNLLLLDLEQVQAINRAVRLQPHQRQSLPWL